MTDSTVQDSVAPGETRSPSYRQILAADRGRPPAFLSDRSTHDLGNGRVPKDRYTSAEWHQQEIEKLWKRVWQLACRENDIPNVGDRLAYDIANQSVLIVRSGPDEIKAFHNTCRHRGNKLVEGCSQANNIRCSFHGWTWDLNGQLEAIPCRWDFPEVRDDEYGLVECRVARWNEAVFINLDPDAAPFEEFLGPQIPEQWAEWRSLRTHKIAHVARVTPCNWKVALEAFMESYHVVATHPQFLFSTPYDGTQYDFYGPHARMVTPFGLPSPEAGPGIDPQMIVDGMVQGDAALSEMSASTLGSSTAGVEIPQVAPGENARRALAEYMKRGVHGRTNLDVDTIEDWEVLDGVEYVLFPNTCMWMGYFYPLMYRFRPNGNDPDSCIFEIMVINHIPDGQPLPADVPMRFIAPDEPFSTAPELGALAEVFDQDNSNLMKIQQALHSDSFTHVTYANVQERNLRNFHAWLDEYIHS